MATPTKKNESAAASSGYQYASVREVVNSTTSSTYVVKPASLGTALFVKGAQPPVGSPFKNLYDLLAYVGSDTQQPTTIALPDNASIVVMDLPNGMFTPRDEIAAVLQAKLGPGGSSGVGPTNSNP